MSGSLFDQPRPMPDPPHHHNAPPGTSSVAASMIRPKASTLRELVLNAIRAAGPHGLCDNEGEILLGIAHTSYSPRRRELAQAGFVVDSGRRRLTPASRPATAWIAAEHADREEA